jgi:hypothetical protein
MTMTETKRSRRQTLTTRDKADLKRLKELIELKRKEILNKGGNND